jgi:hypothetical protein
MSAVRLAAVTWEPQDGKPVPDMENPRKRDFHRLLQRGDFISAKLLPLIQKAEKGVEIAHYFDEVQVMLCYRGSCDAGLPKQAFPLLRRPLVQVLLRLAQVGYLKNKEDMARRKDVLRLVLFWLVAVTDASKASHLAYKVIEEKAPTEKCDPNVVLGRAIHDQLVTEGAAVALPALEVIKTKPGLVFSPGDTTLLRGESRFDYTKHGEEGHSSIYHFYRNHWWRPWTYQHPFLLWLQREMVAEKLDPVADPMAGKDEDTPYDYDHILPYAHWGMWTGVSHGDRLLDSAERQIWVVGNGIGNVRVWASSLNRADSDSPPTKKLAGVEKPDELDENLLKYSAIRADKIDNWKEASGNGKPRSWNSVRAIAFQSAVEERTFYLYERYYNELGFAEWPYSAVV